jgi:hypothetical protein
MPTSELEKRIEASKREGTHATIYLASGDTYRGEWKNDRMHGSSYSAFVA